MALDYPTSTIHWNYFLTLEEDFGVVTRFVEPCKENEKTFSIELSRLIMASTQEADVLLKSLCGNISPGDKSASIQKYHQVLRTHLPQIFDTEVFLERYQISTKPFLEWSENSPPEWWTANNKIKHHRSTEFNRATLANAVASMAALLVLNLYYWKSEFERINKKNIAWFKVTESLVPESKYFYLERDFYQQTVVFGSKEW